MDDMVPGPQVRAASVNSWITADTWTAEISAALAQADETLRASTKDVLARHKAATEAANFIHVIQTLFAWSSVETLAISPDTRQAFGKRELSKLESSFMNPEQDLHVLKEMRHFGTLALALAALAAGSSSAWAFRLPDPNAAPLTEHQKQLRYADSQRPPYAMNYADEAAQSLGVTSGKWEAFSTQPANSLMPSFRGGIDGGRAMIGLQWRR